MYMKKLFSIVLLSVLIFPALTLAQHAIVGEKVYTMSGNMIENGVVLVKDGKIERVGSANRVSIPDGYEVHNAKVVTPGLIDSRTVVGLNGIYNIDDDQDALERSNPIQPELRAFDAYNPREDLVDWVRSLGITTIHTGHAPGALASGQTMVIKTDGSNDLDNSILDSTTTIAMTLGSTVSRFYNRPGTRSKAVAMLRAELHSAKEYMERQDSDNPPNRDLGKEALADVLRGNISAMVTANRSTEIMTAMRIANEFGIEIILDGAAEAYMLIDEIKAGPVKGIIIHPTMIRTGGDFQNAAFTTAGVLHEAGIPIYFQSGFEGYVPKTRVVLYEAAVAVANGLDYEAGLAALTIEAAKFFGIDDRVGSLETGKDADIVLFNGDPFEYVTQVCKVFINGNIVSDDCI